MGVALYERGRGFPTWALVFHPHPERFSSDDVRIYRIATDTENWFSEFKACTLEESSPWLVFLPRVRVPSLEIPDMFMSSFLPGRDKNNLSFEAA